MPVNSRSVRAGITAMLETRNANEATVRNGTEESDILLARSGYIVVAG